MRIFKRQTDKKIHCKVYEHLNKVRNNERILHSIMLKLKVEVILQTLG